VPAERLAAMRLIVTPGTIVRWQRDIVRRRWARRLRQGRSGRPATHRKVRAVVLRLARENESWAVGGSTASSQGSASTRVG
jgi:putative transposase